MALDPNLVLAVIGASANMLAITVAILALIPVLAERSQDDRSSFFAAAHTRRQARRAIHALGGIVIFFSFAMIAGVCFFALEGALKHFFGLISVVGFLLGTIMSGAASVWLIIRSRGIL